MKLYEEINNSYANELLEMTSLIIYAHCGPSWKWSSKPHKTGFVVSYMHRSTCYSIAHP